MVVWIAVYCAVVLVVYGAWKYTHYRTTLTKKSADGVFEKFFSSFQEAIVRYDQDIYRSDKAYPILTKPLVERMHHSNHSLKHMNSYIKVFNQERTTLQKLVPQDIGISPLHGFEITHHQIAQEGLSTTLWYMLAIGTFGIWAVFQLR